jgi:branched-chain amino acid transport system substrate-binding protein
MPVPAPQKTAKAELSTSPANYKPVRHMQLQRWDGRSWVRFGRVIEGADV